MPGKSSKTVVVSVRIPVEQYTYLKRKRISLTKLVRKLIDKMMEKEGVKRAHN